MDHSSTVAGRGWKIAPAAAMFLVKALVLVFVSRGCIGRHNGPVLVAQKYCGGSPATLGRQLAFSSCMTFFISSSSLSLCLVLGMMELWAFRSSPRQKEGLRRGAAAQHKTELRIARRKMKKVMKEEIASCADSGRGILQQYPFENKYWPIGGYAANRLGKSHSEVGLLNSRMDNLETAVGRLETRNEAHAYQTWLRGQFPPGPQYYYDPAGGPPHYYDPTGGHHISTAPQEALSLTTAQQEALSTTMTLRRDLSPSTILQEDCSFPTTRRISDACWMEKLT
nr:hypothetical protein Iba_chr04aCG12340 [Ipomoea batatas]